MDEALKARLIGAAVLVAVAVLLIPELLSGRKPGEQMAGESAGTPGKRIITIELGGGPGQPTSSITSGVAPAAAPASSPPAVASAASEQATRSAQDTPAIAPSYESEAPASEPATASEQAPAEAPPAATAATPQARPAPAAPQSTPPPGAAPRPGAGGWAVQVGAFGSVATANDMVRRLQADGYHAFVAPTQRSGKTLHRVRVGPEAQKAGAERLAGQLKAKGLPATVVQNE
jgi:DedD protein